jgi:KaiC/GvpD/RAD55 family RecA-like ATPase
VFDNPPTIGDCDYDEVQTMFSKAEIVRKEEEEIKDYKRGKTLMEVRQAKENDKIRGIFSLKNVQEIWQKHYEESIAALDESMEHRLPCITPILSEVVPLEGVEMILLAAESGKGKTSSAVNILTPIVEEGRRVLYISTEERAEDILIKTAALINGGNSNDQRTWTEEMKLKRNADVKELVYSQKLLVVDNYCPGVDEKTGKPIKAPDLTNLEEFKMVLNSVLRDKLQFDLLIVDYISKVGSSNDKEKEWEVLYRATKFVEEWTKSAKIPSVVFTQLKVAETEKQEFQQRLPGSKRILNSVTCAIEIKTDYDAQTSTWICHKNRKYGKLFKKTLKFDKGRYIDMPEPTDN